MLMEPYVPADCIEGMSEDWQRWMGCRIISPARFDARIPADRDFLSRVLAGVLGVPVGANAPSFEVLPGMMVPAVLHSHFRCEQKNPIEAEFWVRPLPRSTRSVIRFFIPALAGITDPNEALACVVRWVGEEVRAGRIEDRRKG
jgi:hypothetical protein